MPVIAANPPVSVPATMPPAPRTAPGEAAADPAGEPAADLERVQDALRRYRNALGGNPVGNNAEITRALLGDNLKQVKVPLPPGSSVSGSGEMLDHWGTAYFFHQLSGTQMEVRSAGPDRQMWNDDDLLQK